MERVSDGRAAPSPIFSPTRPTCSAGRCPKKVAINLKAPCEGLQLQIMEIHYLCSNHRLILDSVDLHHRRIDRWVFFLNFRDVFEAFDETFVKKRKGSRKKSSRCYKLDEGRPTYPGLQKLVQLNTLSVPAVSLNTEVPVSSGFACHKIL